MGTDEPNGLRELKIEVHASAPRVPGVPSTIAEGPFCDGPEVGVVADAFGVACSTQLSALVTAASPLELSTTSDWFSPLFWPKMPPNVIRTYCALFVVFLNESTQRPQLAVRANFRWREISIPLRFTACVVANSSTPSNSSPNPRSSSPSMRCLGVPSTLTRKPATLRTELSVVARMLPVSRPGIAASLTSQVIPFADGM